MKTLQQVEKFVREYIADEWYLFCEIEQPKLDDTSFDELRANFFDKYFASGNQCDEFEKILRRKPSSGIQIKISEEAFLARNAARELFQIKQYTLPAGENIFRAYISTYHLPLDSEKDKGRLYGESLFVTEVNGELKVTAVYSPYADYREPAFTKELKEKGHLLQDAYLVWRWRGGEIITSEMIEDLTDGVKFVQPAIENGHAGDYMRPITNNKLGELDLNSIDLTAEVIDQLKNGKYTGRHSGLPYGSWVKNAWDVANKSNKTKISQALYESLKSDDTWLRMEALVTIESYGSDLLGSEQCIDLLTNNIDKFAGQRHTFDSPSTDRGESFVSTMYRAAIGSDKKAALELIRGYVLDSKYTSIAFGTLAKQDSVWLKSNISQIKKVFEDHTKIDELSSKYKL